MESREVVFFENIFPMKDKLSKSIGENSMSNSSIENQAGTELIRNKRGRTEKNIDNDLHTYIVENDPRTYNKAMALIDATFEKMLYIVKWILL